MSVGSGTHAIKDHSRSGGVNAGISGTSEGGGTLVDHEQRDLDVVLRVGSRAPGLVLYLDQRGHDPKVDYRPRGKEALAARKHEAQEGQTKHSLHSSPLIPSDGMIGSPSRGVCWLKS